MNINSIDLKILRKPLEEALYDGYVQTFPGLIFHEFEDMVLTPEKPNSARTVIPVSYLEGPHKKEHKIGNMYVIAFARGDGTGDDKTFKLEDITIPGEYRHNTKPEKVIPRAKTGIALEGFLPLFSLTPKEKVLMYTTSLEELGLDENKKLVKLTDLGMHSYWFKEIIREASYVKQLYTPRPTIHYTTYTRASEKIRMVDPHAIHYNSQVADDMNIGGFLAINSTRHPFLDSLKKMQNEAGPKKVFTFN